MFNKRQHTMGVTGGLGLACLLLAYFLQLWFSAFTMFEWADAVKTAPTKFPAPYPDKFRFVMSFVCVFAPLVTFVVLWLKQPWPRIIAAATGLLLSVVGLRMCLDLHATGKLDTLLGVACAVYVVPGVLAAVLYLLPWSKAKPRSGDVDAPETANMSVGESNSTASKKSTKNSKPQLVGAK